MRRHRTRCLVSRRGWRSLVPATCRRSTWRWAWTRTGWCLILGVQANVTYRSPEEQAPSRPLTGSYLAVLPLRVGRLTPRRSKLDTIEMENAVSQLQAPKEVIEEVRHLVAYKKLDLPPSWVTSALMSFRSILKREDGSTRTYGMDRDLERFYTHSWGRWCEEHGFGPDRWTERRWMNAWHADTTWDGWTSLMTSTGRFGTGLLSHVERALTLRLGRPAPRILDHRKRVDMGLRPFPRRPTLWSHQEEAVQAWRDSGHRGVIDLPPRSGKTRLAAAAIVDVGVPTLMVVPRVELVRQTVAEFTTVLGEGTAVAVSGGTSAATRKRALAMIRCPIWVATPATALQLDLPSRAMLVIDEFHHSSAKTYRKISKGCTHAFYRLGLTGTHFRADGTDMVMRSVLARAVYSRTVQEMVQAGVVAPTKGVMVQTRGEATGRKTPDMEHRNKLICWAAQHLASRGKRVLILATEIRHVEALAAGIPGAVAVDGRDNKAVRPALDDLEARRIHVVVGTSVIGEGVNVPAADAMVYAAGSRSRVKVVQDTFRILTAHEGKTHGVLIDFADEHDDGAVMRAAERLHYYRQNGFEMDVVPPTGLIRWLDDNC